MHTHIVGLTSEGGCSQQVLDLRGLAKLVQVEAASREGGQGEGDRHTGYNYTYILVSTF